MAINNHTFFQLELLNHVEDECKLSNRLAAKKLGVSVRLAHELLKKMVAKGWLHVKVINSRRWDYFLTARGMKEKARLTGEFFEFSMHFYREARKQSAGICKMLSERGMKDIGFLGSGDLAEIAYLGVQEWKLNLVEVYDDIKGKTTFLHAPIKPLHEVTNAKSEEIIVCLYDRNNPMKKQYLPPSVTSNRAFHWIF